MNLSDDSDSSVQETEDPIFDQAESKYRSLLGKSDKNRFPRAKIEELEKLLAERIHLKLQLTYERLEYQISCVQEETFSTFEEQQSLMVRILTEQCGMDSLSAHHSFLDHIGFLSEASNVDINKWAIILPSILHNELLRPVMPLLLSEYRNRTERVWQIACSIHDQLGKLINTGLYVLCRLSPSKVPVEFLRKFADGLDSFNLLVSSLRSFCEHCCSDFNLPKSNLQQINLKKLLQFMAKHQGLFLGELACRTIQDHIMLVSCDSQGIDAIRNDDVQVPRKKKNVRPDPTSDYYSSSASSTRTENKLPPIKQRPRLNFKLHNQMQDLYTGFLEQRYTVFISLLDCCGKHRSLYEATKVQKQKTVIWLDDVVQKQRKRLWKLFVSDLWQAFQNNLVQLIQVGSASTPSLFLCNSAIAKEIVTLVKDALAAVPLPDSLISYEGAQTALTNMYETSVIYKGIISFAISARKDKCLPLNSSVFGTETGMHLKGMINDQLLAHHKHIYTVLCQAGAWWTSTKGVHLAAAYRLTPFLAVRYGDTVWCRNSKFPIQNALTMLDRGFEAKFRTNTIEHLSVAIPNSKSFMASTKEVSDHTIYMVTSILEPIFVSGKQLKSTRIHLFQNVVTSFLATWVTYLVEKPFKMNQRCAKILEEDFSFVQEWIRNCEHLSSEERRTLSDLPIFNYLTSGIAVLLEANSLPRDASVRFQRRNKRIFPSGTFPDEGPGPSAVQTESVHVSLNKNSLPPLEQWQKMKKNYVSGFGCFSMC